MEIGHHTIGNAKIKWWKNKFDNHNMIFLYGKEFIDFIVTNNYALSERMKMIRNHAEAVLRKRKNFSLNNMIGYNFRMCEIEAAIGIQQLKKLNKIVNNNQSVVKKFINSLKGFHGLTFLKTPKYSTNVYYVLPILYSEKLTGFSFDKVIKELNKAGVPIVEGYQNLHLLPS